VRINFAIANTREAIEERRFPRQLFRASEYQLKKEQKDERPNDARPRSQNQCGQELIEIDNRGGRLVGCLTCNLWTAALDTAKRGAPTRPPPAASRRIV